MIKVTKKVERMARAMCLRNLIDIGHDMDFADERTDEYWMAYVPDAESLNRYMNAIHDTELVGCFTQEEFEESTR
jgi:hypothetical protein